MHSEPSLGCVPSLFFLCAQLILNPIVAHLFEYFAIPYLVAFGVKPLGLCLALRSSRAGFNINLISGYMQLSRVNLF